MLCASALAVVLWSAGLARAGAFNDQTASLFPFPDPIGSGFRDGAANWGDYNNDGYVDISFPGTGAPVWQNDGGTSFSFAGWFNTAGPAVWGDYNNDGRLDAYGFAGNTLLRNQSSASSTSFDKPITMPTRPTKTPIAEVPVGLITTTTGTSICMSPAFRRQPTLGSSPP